MKNVCTTNVALTDNRINPLQEISILFFFNHCYSAILCVFSCKFSELNFKKSLKIFFVYPHKYKASVVCNELNDAGLKERRQH